MATCPLPVACLSLVQSVHVLVPAVYFSLNMSPLPLFYFPLRLFRGNILSSALQGYGFLALQGLAKKQTVTLFLFCVSKRLVTKVIQCRCRTWRTDLPRGTCMLVAISVEHEEAPLMGAVRAIVMDSQYLIEPCGSGKARLTHICRIDLK